MSANVIQTEDLDFWLSQSGRRGVQSRRGSVGPWFPESASHAAAHRVRGRQVSFESWSIGRSVTLSARVWEPGGDGGNEALPRSLANIRLHPTTPRSFVWGQSAANRGALSSGRRALTDGCCQTAVRRRLQGGAASRVSRAVGQTGNLNFRLSRSPRRCLLLRWGSVGALFPEGASDAAYSVRSQQVSFERS